MRDPVEDSLDRLEADEPEDATELEQAEHWLDVYRRLIELTESVYQRTLEHMQPLPDEAQRHVKRSNFRVMDQELARFREREQVWSSRVDALRRQAPR